GGGHGVRGRGALRGRRGPAARGIVAAALCVVALALAGCGRRYSVGPRDTVGDFELRLPAVVRRDLEGGLQVLAITGSPASVVVGVALRASDRADDPALEQLTFAALADEAERAAATRGALFAASQVDD